MTEGECYFIKDPTKQPISLTLCVSGCSVDRLGPLYRHDLHPSARSVREPGSHHVRRLRRAQPHSLGHRRGLDRHRLLYGQWRSVSNRLAAGNRRTR